jgi:nitrilase
VAAIKAAVLQQPNIGMSSTRLYRYVRQAHKEGVRVLLLGEYLLNPFFHELKSLSLSMIREQSEHQLSMLKELSQTYDMVIVAPLVMVRKKAPYKVIIKVAPNSVHYYDQQVLINYSHWNEAAYFANETEKLKAPPVFMVDGIRCALMAGFELHFDALFEFLDEKKIDLLLVPSVSTFESHQRWQELIKMRAFTHNTYILRANRIGEYHEGKYAWKFYGDSLFCDPNGEIIAHLRNTEELMVVSVDHHNVMVARKEWGFFEARRRRQNLI